MSSAGATSAIVLSALVVGGLYAWRWLSGGQAPTGTKITAKALIGLETEVSPEGFLIAWGAIYMMLALLSTIAAPLSGALAILIGLGALAANFSSVAGDAQTLVASKSAGASAEGPAAGVSAGTSPAPVGAPLAVPPSVAPLAVPPSVASAKANLKPASLKEVLALNKQFANHNVHLTRGDVFNLAEGKLGASEARQYLENRLFVAAKTN